MFSQLKNTLEKNGFIVSIFSDKNEAADYLNSVIDGKTVGAGGSMSLQDLGILPRLAMHNTVYKEMKDLSRQQIDKSSMNAEIYLMSANAIAENTGEILNIDGIGNRVSSSLFGHQKVYIVAGKNKISPDFTTALWRLKNVVAPKNAQRLNRKTPCALKADKCYNCNSPERICKALVVHYKKIESMDMEVILVNENLGY